MTQDNPPQFAEEDDCDASIPSDGPESDSIARRVTKNATDTATWDEDEVSPSCASASDGVDDTTRQCSALEVALVRRLFSSGRTDDARNLLDDIRASTDARDEAELLLGELLLAEGRVSEATACFLGMLADNPRHVPALKAVAQLHKRSGDLPRAVEVCSLRMVVLASCRGECAPFKAVRRPKHNGLKLRIASDHHITPCR